MKIILFLVAAAGGSLFAQAQEDPLARHLVSPGMVMEKADAIGLTAEQREAVRQLGEGAHVEAEEAKQTLEEAMKALGGVLQKDVIDEKAATARLDTVLEAERVMKRIHLQTLVRVHNLLTAEQRSAMRGFSPEGNGRAAQMAAIEKNLKAKLERVKTGMEAKAQSGEHPTNIIELMKEFHPLMEQGKHAEAEKILDRALEMLGGKEAENPAPDSSSAAPQVSPGTPGELKAEIAGMRVDDVAWRKIEWKTCLLDGLRASREQKKPIILWCFIDRPVDDKRC